MKLETLRKYRDAFKDVLRSNAFYDQVFKWECQDIFQREWDLEAVDFAAMYDRALSHPTSGSLWGGNHASAKSVMLDFIQANKEFVRSMFRDLFTQQKDLSMRIERFHFHCDQLLEQMRLQNRRTNHHFHEDFYMPTLYLSLRYPEQMCPYHPDTFKKSLLLIGAKNPEDSTLDRYTKVIPIYQSQLLQDEEIGVLLREKIKLRDPKIYSSWWLAHEFYHFIAK